MVVGVGAIGALLEAEPKRPKPATHAGALLKNKKTDLIAIVDTDSEMLSKASKFFPKAHTYTSLETALSIERPDILCIATPPASHQEIVKQAVAHGVKMIVCEKPIAVSTAQAHELAHILDAHPVTFVLNYQRRYFDLFADARQSLAKGDLGSIQTVTCYYSNGLYNNGGHAIDALAYLLNDEVTSVRGWDGAGVHPVGDIQANVFVTYRKGTVAHLIPLNQEHYGVHDIQIFGTRGAYYFSDYGYTRTFIPVRPSVFAQVAQLVSKRAKKKEKKESMVAGALADVIDAYEQKRVPVSGILNGLQSMKTLDTIRESVENDGKEITL